MVVEVQARVAGRLLSARFPALVAIAIVAVFVVLEVLAFRAAQERWAS